MCLAYGVILYKQKEINRSEYGIVVCGVFVCAFCTLSIRRVMIQIDNDGILDRKIFSQTYIPWIEINGSDIIIESQGHGISPRWLFERVDKKPYKMDVPYSKKNYRILAEALVMRAPLAQLSNKIIKLSEGKNTNLMLDN
jgi:hypothetical protein